MIAGALVETPLVDVKGKVMILGETRHVDSSKALLITIIGPDAEEKQVIEIKDMSGDWGAATLSPDGRFLIIGVPYALNVYQQQT